LVKQVISTTGAKERLKDPSEKKGEKYAGAKIPKKKLAGESLLDWASRSAGYSKKQSVAKTSQEKKGGDRTKHGGKGQEGIR